MENVLSCTPADVEKEDNAFAVGCATYPIILEFAKFCVELIKICASDDVVDTNCWAIPSEVEFNVEYKYTLPVLYSEDTSVLIYAKVLGTKVLSVD